MDNSAMTAPAASDVASTAESRRAQSLALGEAVASLPENLRSIVVLRFEEGLSFASIGRAIGASESTAHDRLGKALERLRGFLRAGHGEAGLGALVVGPGALVRSLESWGEGLSAPEVPAGLAGDLRALHGQVASGAATSRAGTSKAGASGVGEVGTIGVFAGAAAALGAAVLSGVLMAQGNARSEPVPEANQVGAAAVSGAPRGSLEMVDAMAQGQRSPASAVGVQAAPNSQDDAPAPKAFVLTGQVIDGSGTGVAAATVRASTVEREGKRPLWSSTVAAGADGRFELPVVFEGKLHGVKRAELILDAGHLGYLHLGKSRVHAAPGGAESVELEIALPSGERAGNFTLDVLVRGPSGEPLAGAVVALSHVAPREKTSVGPGVPFPQWSATEKWLRLDDGAGRTDTDGRVRLSGERLGAKSLWVEPLGNFAPVRQSLAMIAEGDQAHDVRVETGARIQGTVAWVEAGPMVAAELKGIQISAVIEPNRWRTIAVDPDGTFEIEGLASHAHVLRVGPSWSWSPKLGDRPSHGRLDVIPGGAPLDIRMKRSTDPRDVGLHDVELHGEAVDALSGEPIALSPGDLFSWRLWDLPSGDHELDLLPNLIHAPAVQRMISSGGAAFGIHKDSLDPGPYMIQVSSRGHGLGVIGPIVTRPGEVRSGLQVKVGEPGWIDVVVVDGGGQPVEGAWAFVTGAGPYSDSVVASVDKRYREVNGKGSFTGKGGTRTDAQGKARIGRLPHGLKCTVCAVHPSFAAGRSVAIEIEASRVAGVQIAMPK